MQGSALRRSTLVAVLVGSLFHAGCAAARPLRFLEPEGARIEIRGPRSLYAGWAGTVPFQTRLPGGAWLVEVEPEYLNGPRRPPLRGALIVREVAEWEESPVPAEFRLTESDLQPADRNAVVRWSSAGGPSADLRFKGSQRGITLDDSEVQEWLAEASAELPPRDEPAGRPPRESEPGPPLREADEVTWGTVVLVVFLIPVYVVFAGIVVVRGIFGAGPP